MGASCCAIRAVDREYAASAYGGYTHPTGTATAAEHSIAHAAGAAPSHLCPADRKRSRTSAANHVGAAATAAYHSDRAIGGKYTASAHGRYTHPTRTEAAAERTSAHATGTGPSCLCSASHKGGRVSTVNHAGTAAGAASHSDHANGRKYTASAHERYTHPVRSKAAAERTNVSATGAGPSRLCQAVKEIPRRKNVCAGSSSYGAAGNPACG